MPDGRPPPHREGRAAPSSGRWPRCSCRGPEATRDDRHWWATVPAPPVARRHRLGPGTARQGPGRARPSSRNGGGRLRGVQATSSTCTTDAGEHTGEPHGRGARRWSSRRRADCRPAPAADRRGGPPPPGAQDHSGVASSTVPVDRRVPDRWVRAAAVTGVRRSLRDRVVTPPRRCRIRHRAATGDGARGGTAARRTPFRPGPAASGVRARRSARGRRRP